MTEGPQSELGNRTLSQDPEANGSNCQALALLRIGVALCVLFQCYALAPKFSEAFGDDALFSASLNGQFIHPWTPSIDRLAPMMASVGVSRSVILRTIFVAMTGAAHFLLLGVWPRTSALIAWATHFVLKSADTLSAYGAYEFVNITLFYCAVLPTGCIWVLGKRAQSDLFLTSLGIRVLRLHVGIIYGAAGIEKACGEQWWTGEAVWRALAREGFRAHAIVDLSRLAHAPAFLVAIGWITVLLELLYPLALYSRMFSLPFSRSCMTTRRPMATLGSSA
jgi:hypothetical protein